MLMNDVVDDVILLQEIYFIFLFLRYTHECGVRWWMMDLESFSRLFKAYAG